MAPTEATLMSPRRSVHGVDISADAIAVAQQRLTSARTIQPDDRAPFEPDSLDGLILADVLEHLPAAWTALADFSRAVRPGGWVIISVPNMRSFKVLKTLIIDGDWPEDEQGIFDQTHLQVMSRKRLTRWCKNAGLVPEQWFDQYAMGGQKQKMLKLLDAGTLRLFHELTQHRLMVRCRKSV